MSNSGPRIVIAILINTSERLLKVGVLTGSEVDLEDRFDGMDRPVTRIYSVTGRDCDANILCAWPIRIRPTRQRPLTRHPPITGTEVLARKADECPYERG